MKLSRLLQELPPYMGTDNTVTFTNEFLDYWELVNKYGWYALTSVVTTRLTTALAIFAVARVGDLPKYTALAAALEIEMKAEPR